MTDVQALDGARYSAVNEHTVFPTCSTPRRTIINVSHVYTPTRLLCYSCTKTNNKHRLNNGRTLASVVYTDMTSQIGSSNALLHGSRYTSSDAS